MFVFLIFWKSCSVKCAVSSYFKPKLHSRMLSVLWIYPFEDEGPLSKKALPFFHNGVSSKNLSPSRSLLFCSQNVSVTCSHFGRFESFKGAALNSFLFWGRNCGKAQDLCCFESKIYIISSDSLQTDLKMFVCLWTKMCFLKNQLNNFFFLNSEEFLYVFHSLDPTMIKIRFEVLLK